jgi:hypothetical protein
MKLANGAPASLSVSIAALVVSFLPWQSASIGPFTATVSEWQGIGVLAGLLLVALVIWNALRVGNVPLPVPVAPALPGLAVAALLLLLTLIKFLAANEFRTFWAWLGLLLAILIVVAAYLEAEPMLKMLRAMRSGATPGNAAAGGGPDSAGGSGVPAAPAAPPAPAGAVTPAAPLAPAIPVTPAAPPPSAAPDAADAPVADAAPAPSAPPAGAAGVDGEWHCTMSTPLGDQVVALTLSTAGGELSGQANSAFGSQAFTGGTVDGGRLAWHISAKEPMPIELDFTATVTGDTLSGMVKAGPLGESAFTGTRV